MRLTEIANVAIFILRLGSAYVFYDQITENLQNLCELSKIFTHCTVQMFLNPTFNSSTFRFQETIFNSLICYPSVQWVGLFSVNVTKQNTSLASKSFNEDWSLVYQDIFGAIRYHSLCTVQFTDKMYNYENSLYFNHADNLARMEIEKNYKMRAYPSMYFFVLVNAIIELKSFRIALSPFMQSTVLLVSIGTYKSQVSMFIPLLNDFHSNSGLGLKVGSFFTDTEFRQFHLTSVPVIKVDDWQNQLRSIKDLDRIWNDAQEASYLPHDDQTETPPGPMVCPMEWYQNQKDRETTSSYITDCITRFAHVQYNCSYKPVCKLILEIQTKSSFIFHWGQYFPFGADIHGIRYSFLVDINQFRNWNGHQILSLLAPFTLNEWLMLSIILILLGIVLNLNGLRTNPIYWLLRVYLEQNEDTQANVSWMNWYLILGWTFTTLLLRMSYTSTMYSYMTLEMEPEDLPKNFEDLVKSTQDTDLLTVRAIYNHISGFEKESNASSANFFEVFKQKTWPTFESKILKFVLNGDRGDSFCREILPHKEKQCLRWNRIGYLYSSGPVDTSGYIRSAYMKLLDVVLNRHKLYESNEPDRFVEHRLWVSPRGSYLTEKLRALLGSVVESGIETLQLYYLQLHDFQDLLNIALEAFPIARQSINQIVSHWMKNGCFKVYRDDKCKLEKLKSNDTDDNATVGDLIALWMLLILLWMIGIVMFFGEIACKCILKYIVTIIMSFISLVK